jgi:hypothetical protein
MGTEQILRIARLTTVTTVAMVTTVVVAAAEVRAQPARRLEPRSEPVVIIDLRPDQNDKGDRGGPKGDQAGAGERARTRAALATELAAAAAAAAAAMQGIALEPGDPGAELALALAGEHAGTSQAERQAARAAMKRAAAAHGRLDCQSAEQAASQAIDALSALQADARPHAITDSLVQAYVYVLLCAHHRGDTDAALLATRRLSRLGVHDPPQGVDSALWSLYPAVDATANLPMAELELRTEPAGAQVWLDHQAVGQAPVTVYVAEGEHIVAAGPARAGPHGGVARRLSVTGQSRVETLALPATGTRWRAVAERVAAWRQDGASGPSPGELGALLTGLGVRFGLVLRDGRRVAIWAVEPGDEQATRIGTATMDQPVDIAARVLERARGWDRTGPDGGTLLRETRATGAALRGEGKASGGQKWWVYATIVGALILGSGIILASDVADDRQRIELRWP